MQPWQIGVFTSVDAGLGVPLDVAREIGVPTVQVHAPHRTTRTADSAKNFLSHCKAAGITVTCVFGGFEGESYSDIATTSRTVGLVPRETRAARVQEMKDISDFTRLLNCPAVGLHLGFVPADRKGKIYKELVEATRGILAHVEGNGQALHLETGQESADHLLDFIHDVDRVNLFINFDPANMILYGIGHPIEALKKVGHLVRSVHCKDAKWATVAERGLSWGTEVALGDGDVGLESFLQTLKELGYRGPLTIEREIAHDRERQKRDISAALSVLQKLRDRIL